MKVTSITLGETNIEFHNSIFGKERILVNGEEAPVLGNICMDMSMIDLSGIDVREGDEVLIFGKQKSVSDLAEKLGTISYEVLAGLSERVKRVYFQESIIIRNFGHP